MRRTTCAILAAIAASGCVTTDPTAGALGDETNPVLADMPPGEHAYLRRLRCSNGQPPAFSRLGSMGIRHSSHVIDGYEATCAGGEPARATIFMDMYHPGHVEARAVPGFTIVP